MPVPISQSFVPWSALDGGTATDAVSGFVDCTIQIHLTGTVANVQADWATLLATNLASPSALLSNDVV